MDRRGPQLQLWKVPLQVEHHQLEQNHQLEKKALRAQEQQVELVAKDRGAAESHGE